MQDLAGKVAVVTGGGSGIGMGIARALARAGVRVVVADVERPAAALVADEIRSFGGRASAAFVDVASLDSVQALQAAVREEFGAVQILCNNAGVSVRRRGIYAAHEDWLWVLGVNLWGVIHGVEVFLPAMLASGEEGHVVNTTSLNGLVPSGQSAMYSASKYGVIGLTETLRNELAESSIGITALCPAAVVSRIHESERNRPKELEPSASFPAHRASSTFDLSAARHPDDIGSMVVDAIRSNQLYVFTDAKAQTIIQEHHDRLLQDFAPLHEWEQRHRT